MGVGSRQALLHSAACEVCEYGVPPLLGSDLLLMGCLGEPVSVMVINHLMSSSPKVPVQCALGTEALVARGAFMVVSLDGRHGVRWSVRNWSSRWAWVVIDYLCFSSSCDQSGVVRRCFRRSLLPSGPRTSKWISKIVRRSIPYCLRVVAPVDTWVIRRILGLSLLTSVSAKRVACTGKRFPETILMGRYGRWCRWRQ